MGKLIVNLQRDARKEFKGSTARRTPQACIVMKQTIALSYFRKNGVILKEKLDIVCMLKAAKRKSIT